jgi:hypothetical protein
MCIKLDQNPFYALLPHRKFLQKNLGVFNYKNAEKSKPPNFVYMFKSYSLAYTKLLIFISYSNSSYDLISILAVRKL